MNPQRTSRTAAETTAIDAHPAGGSSAAPDTPRPHPRTISWVGASALALGGSNQSIFLIGALLLAQGTMAVPLLALGLVLSYMAAPGWIELTCMFPNRVGGIAATCAEAFRPYSAVLANLTGVCYWWGWVPTCGLTAIFSAEAIHQWYLPGVPVKLMATLIVLAFTAVNLCGLRWAVRVAKPVALIAFTLALGSGLIPVVTGHVDWHRALRLPPRLALRRRLRAPHQRHGRAVPDRFRRPRLRGRRLPHRRDEGPGRRPSPAMWFSGGMASVFFVLIPVVWLGSLGAGPLEGNLAAVLGPTFAPLLGGLAKAAAVGFVCFNMFCGTLQPLSGASRTLSQLSEDGLLPRTIGYRSRRTDAPVVAILTTATASIVFLLLGDPISLVAAANLTYLIGIALPSVAVWLLRRNEPDRVRTYRAHDASILLGVAAAVVWLLTTILGFEQFGLPIVIFGLALAFSGSLAYAWRAHGDRKRSGAQVLRRSIYVKLTGAMLVVLVLDGFGYLVAVDHVSPGSAALVAMLKDIFVVVGLLTISVGLVLPGMVAQTAKQVQSAAQDLADGTLAQLTAAMEAMAGDDLDLAHAPVTPTPVVVRTADEFGEMAASFNRMQDEAVRAALALDEAVGELRHHRGELARLVEERTVALIAAHEEIEQAHRRRQDMHERMRVLSSRLGSTDLEGVDLASTLAEIASTLGDVLDVDVVAIYLAGPRRRLRYRADGLAPRAARPPGRRTALVLTTPTGSSSTASPPAGGPWPCPTSPAFAAPPTGPVRRASSTPAATAPGCSPPSTTPTATCSPCSDWAAWSGWPSGTTTTSPSSTPSAPTSAGPSSRPTSTPGSSSWSASCRTWTGPRASSCPPSPMSCARPLTSIRAYTELLRDDDTITPDDDRMLEIIERNSVRLSGLIEDILTLSHLNSAVYDIHLVPVDVDPLIASVCETLAPTAEAKSLTLTPAPASDGAVVLGDGRQLERLLMNLVTNAVKFTLPGGRIMVSSSVSTASVVLSVSDTGIGIPLAEQEAVFGRFFRGSEATQEVIPGTGLGLAIVQAIVEHHGGTLTLRSAPGAGHHGAGPAPLADRRRGPAPNSRLKDAADGADTAKEDLLPVGVQASVGGQDGPGADEPTEVHSKEHHR